MITNNQGWGETLSKDNWDMAYIWHTTNEVEILDILTSQSGKIINRYPYVKEIARKDNT